MDKFSFLNAASVSLFEQMYKQYVHSPDSVEPSWRAFFQGFDFGLESGLEELGIDTPSNSSAVSTSSSKVVASSPKDTSSSPKRFEDAQGLELEFKVIKLINAYQTRGHLFTKTNPVRARRAYHPDLSIENFGLTQQDLSKVFKAAEMICLKPSTLTEIITHLDKIYCSSIGSEYMYIRDVNRRQWIQNKLSQNANATQFSTAEKQNILGKLNEAVSFENFLHTKYVGQKRFSLEGAEALIPALEYLLEKASESGVREFIMGMAHRGRLSTLTNIFGKSAKDIFSEFDGKDYDEDIFDGDVKYHMGWTGIREFDNGRKINVNIAPNPSHLETVGAVVEGIARAKQDRYYKDNAKAVLPLIVHGDAAVAGQGIAYEIVQMAQLDGYKTSGTIHIVVNNQIGFTTNYTDARSSIYCTDVAKVTLCPVFHVNADDAEAVVHVVNFALAYRQEFQRDVFIDLLGYRKYGHNEGDEPRFTQPKLYKAIAKHRNSRDIYAEKLLAEGVIDAGYVSKIESDYKNELEKQLHESRKEDKTVITPFMEEDWKGFSRVQEDQMLLVSDTSYPLEKLDQIAEVITTLPKEHKFLRKIERLIAARHKMYFDTDKLDWAMGELLAYGSLLQEGYDVRLSGQDVERGTFSHRHAVVKVEDSEQEIVRLNDLEVKGDFYVYNSFLSEYGVVGFDYGYAMASPKTLTIWEAQFGDFSNGAQIMIDQYISAAEDKWKMQNGLVMLLPHGYEGQGAEHSSARMERYLQLCAKDNMFVADVSTPANLFHLLRRQMKSSFRKPLIIFTPKSLLRHPRVLSSKSEFTNGQFQMLIKDDLKAFDAITSLVFCTGKFYYDLLDEREKLDRTDVALVRIEQLFPLPVAQMQEVVDLYPNLKEVVWAQEEPRNMGATAHIMMHYPQAHTLRYATRRAYGAPAAGSATRSKRRHQEVIDYVFDASKNNQRNS